MRILWVSDSPNQPSGYGTVTDNICSRLRQRGHHVDVLGLQATHTEEHEGLRVWPIGEDRWASDVLVSYLERLRPDFLVTLGDLFTLGYAATPDYRKHLDALGVRWVFYYPLEADLPDGGLPANWTDVLSAVDVRVTTSLYGRNVSAHCGLDSVCIPHGVDLNLFRPPQDKQQAKADLGYQGKFLILSDTLNQTRKVIPRALQTVARFVERHPDTVFHLHCDPHDPKALNGGYLYDIVEDVSALGLSGKVHFSTGFQMGPGRGLPARQIAGLYAAADVHLLCSYGEGFGLPTLQAAAAGVPPLAVDYSASRELVGKHGFAIPTQWAVNDEYGFARHLLDVDKAVEALDQLYHSTSAEVAARSAACRTFAESYGWDGVVDQWEEILTAPPNHRVPGATASASDMPKRGELTIPVQPSGRTAVNPRRWIFAGPGDVQLATRIQKVFPGLVAAVSGAARPSFRDTALAPLTDHFEVLQEAVVALDFNAGGLSGLDLACAALDVPYAGDSILWPPIGPADPFLQARLLLTDHGLSAWRQSEALRATERRYGRDAIDQVRRSAQVVAERV